MSEITTNIEYLTNTEELTYVADAIREKSGVAGSLSFPFGYVNAIENIELTVNSPDISQVGSVEKISGTDDDYELTLGE